MTIQPQSLEQLKELSEKATQGEWYVGSDEHMVGSGDRDIITYRAEKMENGRQTPVLTMRANQHFKEGPYDAALAVASVNYVRSLLTSSSGIREQALEEAASNRFYIDCEFDGHGGSLLSIAMVSEGGRSIHVRTIDGLATDPWVIENVVPLLDEHEAEIDTSVFTDNVGSVIRRFIDDCASPIIIADSPVDIGRFCAAISTSPEGGWASTDYPGMTFEVHNVDCYPTDLPGAVQHNAYWDAMALRHKLSSKPLDPPPRQQASGERISSFAPPPGERIRSGEDGRREPGECEASACLNRAPTLPQATGEDDPSVGREALIEKLRAIAESIRLYEGGPSAEEGTIYEAMNALREAGQ